MLKKKTLVFFSRNCHVHISALFAHKQACTFLCQLFAMQATRLSATFQFRPKQNKSFFNLFAFALPASLPPLSQNTIFTHTTVYPANVEWWLLLLCLTYGGGDGMGNRRRIRWAHTRSQETSLALWKWDTNERVNVLALACMCVCVCVNANALCRSIVPVSASASVVRETWMWTEHPRGINDEAIRKVCDKLASQCVCVCLCAACACAYLTYLYMYDSFSARVHLCMYICVCVRLCSCKNNNTDRVCCFCSHY